MAVGMLVSLTVLVLYFLVSLVLREPTRRKLFASMIGAIVVFNTYGLVFHIAFKGIGLDFYSAGLAALAAWLAILFCVVTLLWFFTNNPQQEKAICIGVTALLIVSLARIIHGTA